MLSTVPAAFQSSVAEDLRAIKLPLRTMLTTALRALG
jgi:hypothetical protein